MTIWKTPITLEELNQRGKGTIVECLGIEFMQVQPNSLAARMPVDSRTRQPIGIMHGGASCVLAETIGSTGANFAVDIKTHYCVGLAIYTQHLRSIREGWVVGHGTPVHIGRSTQVWHINIHDEQDHLISSTQLTLSVLSRNKNSQ